MASPSSTIVIEDDELPPNWRSDLQFQETTPHISAEHPMIQQSDAASGSKREPPDTLDFLFQKLRMAVEQHLERHVERLQQQAQELHEKLVEQEEQHQKQLSRRP
ncbi:uncharacterized protein N7529_000974, partial [Penicillium soppii]|uniref:uncharacterized protein n=1 Tax=Penicillium soppii TaxID=69789 RepID=UPI0025492067